MLLARPSKITRILGHGRVAAWTVHKQIRVYNGDPSSVGAAPMQIDAETLDKFRLKLRSKVRYHVGGVCPDVEDLVQETLVRFLRCAEDDKIRSPSNLGAFLNGVCNNVILEYRRRLWREEPYEPEFHEGRRAAGTEG